MTTTFLSFIKYFAVAVLGFLAPIHYAFIFTIILVVADTITGVMKAGKDDVKQITSKKAFPLVPKLIFYFLLIIVAHSISSIDSQIPFVKLVLIGIGWIEVKSIDENFNEIYGFSFIEKVIEGVKSINKIKRHKEE